MSFIVAGIHTSIGKTVCSAILCETLGYDYWKPVQAGDLDNSDSIFIKNHVSNLSCKVHEERYKLLTAASPHYAASLENIIIKKDDFNLPKTENNLIIETAGGVMSPLATNFLNIDLMVHLNLPVVLVSNNYLGSINHTLLTYAALKQKNISIKGLVFVGASTPATEKYILEYTQMPLLFSVPNFELLNKETIKTFAATLDIKL